MLFPITVVVNAAGARDPALRILQNLKQLNLESITLYKAAMWTFYFIKRTSQTGITEGSIHAFPEWNRVIEK